MIVYFKCICKSSDKLLAKNLQAQGYEVRDIRRNLEWRKQAREYKMKPPFKVADGIASAL